MEMVVINAYQSWSSTDVFESITDRPIPLEVDRYCLIYCTTHSSLDRVDVSSFSSCTIMLMAYTECCCTLASSGKRTRAFSHTGSPPASKHAVRISSGFSHFVMICQCQQY